jgi:hypothetical protein
MRVYDIYLRLDSEIKTSVETYLKDLGVQLIGGNKRKHMKLLGVPSLIAMVEYRKKDERSRTSHAQPHKLHEVDDARPSIGV